MMVSPAAAKASSPLTARQRGEYERTGHLLIRGLLDGDWIARLRPAILAAFHRLRPPESEITRPRTAYELAFIQVVNMGMKEQAVRELTWSPLLGEIAAELMDAPGARIFIEDSMFKEPGGGHTPWHQDGSCLPFEPKKMVTAWVPLRPVGLRSGRVRFVRGSHHLGLLGPVDISEETDGFFTRLIDERKLPIDDNPPMQPGDVSFHHGCTIHGAFPNETSEMRELMAIHYFADGARIGVLDNPTRVAMANHSAPHLRPGDLAVADAWPLVYKRGE